MSWVRQHRQQLFGAYLFCNFAGWGIWQLHGYLVRGEFGFVEASFTTQSLLVAGVFLLRRPHRGLDPSPLHQAVALLAFLSGAGFMGQPATAGPELLHVSRGVVLAANLLGIGALLSLGRSFGVLIAWRGLASGGLYALVRHPMYGADILLRAGFALSHLTPLTAALFAASAALYVWRALLEERFLSREPEYRAYLARVRRRFVPFVA
jgi:protein-S-isoprenylcysteine O-methyltransferase Ste14